MRTKTVDLARGRWPGILLALGVEERYLSGLHSECPLCGKGKNTFRFDDKDGSGSYYCGYCKPGYGIDFVMRWLNADFKQAAQIVDEILGDDQPVQKVESKKDPRPMLRLIEKGLQPLTGNDPASVYLHNRGLRVVCTALKYHPSLTYWDKDDDGNSVGRGKFPAMVAEIVGINGEQLTYHITYLEQGHKANLPSPKKIMSPISPIPGGAIRLSQVGKQLAVAEGIETALAFYEAYKIPVWATSNAYMMEKLVIPEEVKELMIVADNDENFTGQKAAYILANRYALKGVCVKVKIPGAMGHDYLDVLNGKKD
ncbi:MAG: toprim domain-containing protein [Candidatus Sedimenticola sp. (ex Thyasira tokunagai)]